MRESPRIRRLRTDFRAMESLRTDSTVLDYTTPGELYGGPPEAYVVRFFGKGFWRPDGATEVMVRERHEVAITLGASYPRMQPELEWRTPIFHPNISASGVVCLGGYGTHWVPSVNLDELCTMLWDMIRYQNYDVESPYNREAAQWTRTQKQFKLPIDDRPIRDKIAGVAPEKRAPPIAAPPVPRGDHEVLFLDPAPREAPREASPNPSVADPEIVDAEIVEAEIVEPEDPDILFIE